MVTGAPTRLLNNACANVASDPSHRNIDQETGEELHAGSKRGGEGTECLYLWWMIMSHSFHKSCPIWHNDIAHLSRQPFSKTLRQMQKKRILESTYTDRMWDKQVDIYIYGYTKGSFTSFLNTTPLKKGSAMQFRGAGRVEPALRFKSHPQR